MEQRQTWDVGGAMGAFKRGAHGFGAVPIPKAKKIRQKKEDV